MEYNLQEMAFPEILQKRIEEYPECSKTQKQSTAEIGVNVRLPSQSGEMPIPFAQRKLYWKWNY